MRRIYVWNYWLYGSKRSTGNSQKSILAGLLNDLMKKPALLLLDQKIRIYKTHTQPFRGYDANGTFANGRHADKYNIVLFHKLIHPNKISAASSGSRSVSCTAPGTALRRSGPAASPGGRTAESAVPPRPWARPLRHARQRGVPLPSPGHRSVRSSGEAADGPDIRRKSCCLGPRTGRILPPHRAGPALPYPGGGYEHWSWNDWNDK